MYCTVVYCMHFSNKNDLKMLIGMYYVEYIQL